jgi:hypothetical protein
MPPTKPPPPSMTLALDNCDSFALSGLATDLITASQAGEYRSCEDIRTPNPRPIRRRSLSSGLPPLLHRLLQAPLRPAEWPSSASLKQRRDTKRDFTKLLKPRRSRQN